MKKRTREENAAYSRALRARRRGDVAPSVAPDVAPTPDHCANCADLAAEVSRLAAELEAHGRKAAPVSEDETETLRQRVISDKVNRINNYAKGHVIGSARI